MIRFEHPEALLLLPIAAMLLRRALWPRPLLGALRVLVLAAAVVALAQPYGQGEQDGRDVVLVLDRSRSMPPGADRTAAELAAEVRAQLAPGDRIGLLTFGRDPRLAQAPTDDFRWPQAPREPDRDGSDLAAAIDAALLAIPPGRQGSLLVIGDGEATGGDAEAAARSAARAGIRIDVAPVRRPAGDDVAVLELSAPGEVDVGAPFLLSAFVQSGRERTVPWRLLRDGEQIATGEVALQPGRNVLQFVQLVDRAGIRSFALQLDTGNDARPDNDRGLVAVRGTAPARILCVTPGGREDRFTRSLRAAGLEVEVAAPASAPLRLDALDGFRAVVLENVPADELPTGAMPALRTFVRDLGGGLLMTGGPASFGVGGYHRSAVEDVLPVTMEMREEQRRFALAMAIALDRSGSMGAPAGSGTKMDLANAGAAAAIELLTPLDSVAVLAVDSAAHTVLAMQPVQDVPDLVARARSIDAGGGGIFVGEALEAAAAELAAAPQGRRHLVLFADAADAEEPGDYENFVPQLAQGGVTISVIGLGSENDSDAALLRRIAELGGGRCTFVSEPSDLPRVFAQETIEVARSAMVEETTPVVPAPGLLQLGMLPAPFTSVGGYSLAWRRDAAELALATGDEFAAPMLSFWQCGLGRGAAFLGEVDGEYSGELASYGGYAEFFAVLARWLGGGVELGAFADFRREGAIGRLSIEVEPGDAARLDGARGVVVGPDGAATDVEWQREATGRVAAAVPLREPGVYRAAVRVGDVSVRVPPVSLPYSPEHAPRLDDHAGERLLRRIALASGGRVDPSATEIAAGDRRSAGRVALGWTAVLAALVLLLAEIAVRRLHLVWPRGLVLWRRVARATAPGQQPAAAGDAVPARGRRSAAEARPATAAPAGVGDESGERIAQQAPTPPRAPRPVEPESATLSALERARRRGKPPSR